MGAGHVLVIEDDPPSRLMLSRGLAKLGFTVDTSNDAIEAQAKLRAGCAVYEAVVVDLRMPRMDGFEFISWLETFDPCLGCMLLTAQQDDALRDHRDHPTLLYRMQKPTSFPVLGGLVDKIVTFTNGRRATRRPAA